MKEMEPIRTLTALVLGAATLLGGCTAQETVPALAESKAAEMVTSGGPPNCRMTNIASDDYGTEIQPTSGPPHTEVTISGATLRGEDWGWAPSDRLEAWWNTEVPASKLASSTPLKEGPVLRLVRVEDMERCRFRAVFAVPDVEPGRYQISVFVWGEDPADGYGYFPRHGFTVTRR
jgi:hypothetical protein